MRLPGLVLQMHPMERLQDQHASKMSITVANESGGGSDPGVFTGTSPEVSKKDKSAMHPLSSAERFMFASV